MGRKNRNSEKVRYLIFRKYVSEKIRKEKTFYSQRVNAAVKGTLLIVALRLYAGKI